MSPIPEINCHTASQMLSAYLDGELDPGDTLQMTYHLERCAACAKRLDQLVALDLSVRRGLASTPIEEAAYRRRAADINQSVLSRIRALSAPHPDLRQHQSTPWWMPVWRRFSWAQLVLAASLSLGCGLMLRLVSLELAKPETKLERTQVEGRPIPALLNYSAQMHLFCASKMIETDARIAFGERRARALAAEKAIAFPKLADPSFRLTSLHFCRLGQTLVGHYYVEHNAELISVYFGGGDAFQALCADCPEFRLQHYVKRQVGTLLSAAVAATAASPQPSVWVITGKLTDQELHRLVEALGGGMNKSDNQTSRPWHNRLDYVFPQPQVALCAAGVASFHDPSTCSSARTSPA